MKMHAFRLKPGDDVYEHLEIYVKKHTIQAGIILSAVGNIQPAVIRLANENTIKTYSDKQWGFEIVSATGTVATSRIHIHISFSDLKGKTIGGHLKPGCIVRITSEIVIGEIPHIKFRRKFDPHSGFEELAVENLLQD